MADRTLVCLDEMSAAMADALRAGGLPPLEAGTAQVYELRDEERALGWAALERFAADALLRSIILPPERQGLRIGADLVGKIGAAAKQDGIARLWLLTETAASFFERMGFTRAARADAPDSIRATSEFRGVCPASAVCMTKILS